MCSIPYEKFLPQNIFTSPLFCTLKCRYVVVQTFLVALSSLNLLQISVHFIAKNTTKGQWWTALEHTMTMKHWPNVADNSLITWSADQTWQIIHWESWLDKVRHNTKQAHMQGVYYFYYGISILIPFVIILCSYEKTL